MACPRLKRITPAGAFDREFYNRLVLVNLGFFMCQVANHGRERKNQTWQDTGVGQTNIIRLINDIIRLIILFVNSSRYSVS